MFEELKFRLLRVLPERWRRRRLTAFFEREIAGGGERELGIVDRIVKPGDHCVDIGCNMGVYAYRLSKLGAKVTAFEPNPTMASLIEGLALRDVEVRQVALSDRDGEAELRIPIVPAGHALATLRSQLPPATRVRSVKVPTAKLDSIRVPDPAFIKIDVEGFEEQVLAGAVETIDRSRPVLLIEVEERHNEGGLRRVRNWLERRGYPGWYLDGASWRSLVGFDPSRDQYRSRPDGSGEYFNNFLFLPEGRQLPGTA